jgi:hypothetical protein
VKQECLVVLAAALMSCRASAPLPVHEQRPREQAAIEPPAARVLPVSTRAAKMREPPAHVDPALADVVVHVPEGLERERPLHLVVFFHGAGDHVASLIPDCLGGRHDDAGKQSVLVAPQLVPWSGSPGRFGERAYLTAFLEEVLSDEAVEPLGGARNLDDVADVTLVAFSAGHIPLAATLASSDLGPRVRNVVLLDALFEGSAPYVRWLQSTPAGGARRKLVSVHGAWGGQPEAARAIARGATDAVVDPPGALEDAVRAHDVTTKTWPLDHSWVPLLVLSKVLAGLDLPARAVVPGRAAVAALTRPAVPISRGADMDGQLDANDTRLENGAVADDYVLELATGEAVDVTVRGGRSQTENAALDTLVAILGDDGTELAADDDSGGFFDPHLVFRAPRAGAYTIRVMTSGSGEKRGAYSLRVR